MDGWRAVAILGVLAAHDVPWKIFGGNLTIYQVNGAAGVNLFFAISGLLITTRILEEEKLLGHFNIRRFYIRRFFRIQPPAIAYLSVISLLVLCGILHEHWIYLLGGLFLFQNFIKHAPAVYGISFFTGHFWTLAVEEHFYLLLSLILWAVKKHRLAVLVGLTLALQIAMRATQTTPYWDPFNSARRTYWELPFLLLPAAGAVLLQNSRVRQWSIRYLRPSQTILAMVALVILHRWIFHLRRPTVPTFSINGFMEELGLPSAILFPVLVASTMLHARSWLTRFLELVPLRFVGRISYSLYLWHLLFFFPIMPETDVTNPVLLLLAVWPIKFLAAFAVATASYYLLEKPMMRLGHRIAPPATPGRPELVG